ncbi:uncharacterized protein K02A2.6-like [Lucilia sericata]|uniref:uncharacterized protein K02A2.6-like n=1 Tax=Lucilia sericata TaxID=13632 RepID=UPI0018A8754F|nr:uncharacterized protein K02A2.6-like [Lucilia sericata]
MPETSSSNNTAAGGSPITLLPTQPIADFVPNVDKWQLWHERALTKTEINYSTLEKEALAIIFCVTKLRQYLLGNYFTLKTDHKPLLTIFGEYKGLPLMASARLQRWALILSGFNYSVEHVKGTLNDADNLSRMPQVPLVEDYVECNYINLIEKENVFDFNFKKIAKETRRDPILSKVASAINMGTVHQLKGDEFKPYRDKGDELSVEYDCVLWGYRSVVPAKLRKSILESLHNSHFGIVKTKALARSYIWWPAIDKDIEILIKNCRPCQELLPSPEKSVLIPWSPTESVWSRLHIDFAGPIKNKYLLIVIDSLSKWVEVYITNEITSRFTVNKLRELFSRFGLVNTIVSDNGRQFVSHEFKTFLKMNNIKHILTAPGHPSTNGQAENIFLIDYRNTPHCSTGESPAKLLLGRSLKTRFDILRPPLVKEKIKECQEKSVLLHKGKRSFQFSEGEKVLIRNYKDCNKPSWSPATVKQKLGEQNYLCIMSDNNREIKRHLDQIRSLDENDPQYTNNFDNSKRENVLSETNNENNNDASLPPINVKNENGEVVCEDTSNRNLRPRRDGKVVKSSLAFSDVEK